MLAFAKKLLQFVFSCVGWLHSLGLVLADEVLCGHASGDHVGNRRAAVGPYQLIGLLVRAVV